jgi:hypothetical protein
MTIDGWVGGWGTFLQNAFGLIPHYESLQRGVISLGDVVYFLAFTAALLAMNAHWLEGRKHG